MQNYQKNDRSRGVFVTHFLRKAPKIRNKNLLPPPDGRRKKQRNLYENKDKQNLSNFGKNDPDGENAH